MKKDSKIKNNREFKLKKSRFTYARILESIWVSKNNLKRGASLKRKLHDYIPMFNSFLMTGSLPITLGIFKE